MAPEMAISYVVGWIPSLTLSAVHSYIHYEKIHSNSYLTLQKNLEKTNSYWSETESRILPLRDSSRRWDEKASRRSILLIALFSFFLSWVGFFFHLLIFISLQRLAVTRLETAVFESALTTKDLSLDDIETVMKDLRERGLITPI